MNGAFSRGLGLTVCFLFHLQSTTTGRPSLSASARDTGELIDCTNFSPVQLLGHSVASLGSSPSSLRGASLVDGGYRLFVPEDGAPDYMILNLRICGQDVALLARGEIILDAALPRR